MCTAGFWPFMEGSVKAQRALGRSYLASILLIGGCSVYESSLLGGPAEPPSAGSGGVAGDGGSSAGRGGRGGSGAGTDSGSGGLNSGGTDVGHAGESSTSAGANAAGEGGAGACVPETPEQYCSRLGLDCGTVDGTDHCGNAITGADCGTCSGLRTCGGGDLANVCGALTDPALGGNATASSLMFTHEDASMAFDLDITSKWYAGDGNTTGWLAYQFSGTESHVVKSYSVTSANDVPQRDPADWQLQGSDDGSSWTTVDQQSARVFANRRQTVNYSCANTTAYRWYRLLITANSGGSGLQLSELVLYAN